MCHCGGVARILATSKIQDNWCRRQYSRVSTSRDECENPVVPYRRLGRGVVPAYSNPKAAAPAMSTSGRQPLNNP